MDAIQVTPAKVQAALDRVEAGTTLLLAPGAVLDGQRRVPDFDPVAQRLAEAMQINRGFPGVQAMMPHAQLTLASKAVPFSWTPATAGAAA